MTDMKQLTRSFYEGRMIWISGPSGTRKIKMAYSMLQRCGVHEREVLLMAADDFAIRFMELLPDQILKGTRVVVVKNLERILPENRAVFMKTMRLARRVFFTCGVRVMLVSNETCAWPVQLHPIYPLTHVQVQGCRVENVDQRVHWALELACRVSGKRVTRLSPEAAEHLEFSALHSQDDGLIETLTSAVFQSTQGILRLEDFIRSDYVKRGPQDPDLSVCNA